MTTTDTTLPASILTCSQVKTYGPRPCPSWGKGYMIRAKVRFDDQCGNGHNTFSITADIFGPRDPDAGGGCCHKEVAKVFPELAPLIKWHLVSTDGPMHYIANTVYHTEQHPANEGWLYFTDPEEGIRKQCMKYCGEEVANKAIAKDSRYTFELDPKTAKVANLDAARRCAVWPEATDAELTQDQAKLTAALQSRLPALMAEFKRDVEALGFIY